MISPAAIATAGFVDMQRFYGMPSPTCPRLYALYSNQKIEPRTPRAVGSGAPQLQCCHQTAQDQPLASMIILHRTQAKVMSAANLMMFCSRGINSGMRNMIGGVKGCSNGRSAYSATGSHAPICLRDAEGHVP